MKVTIELKPEGFVIAAEDGHTVLVDRFEHVRPKRDMEYKVAPSHQIGQEVLIALGLRNES